MLHEPTQRGVPLFKKCQRYYDVQAYKLAKKCLEAAVRLLPENPEILTTLGLTLQQLGEWDRAETCHSRALEIFQQDQNEVGIIRACLNVGNVFQTSGDLVIALRYYQRAVQIAETSGQDQISGLCWYKLGALYMKQQKNNAALITLQRAIDLLEANNDRVTLIHSYRAIAASYQQMKDQNLATMYYTTALKHAKVIGDLQQISTITRELGNLCEEWAGIEQALTYYKQAGKICQNIGDFEGFITLLQNMVRILTHTGQYDKAHTVFEMAKKTQELILNQKRHAYTLLVHAMAAEKQNKMEYAFEYYRRAAPLFTELELWEEVTTCQLHLGNLYVLFGEFNDALTAYRWGYQTARMVGQEAGIVKNAATCLFNTGRVLQEMGKYQRALCFFNAAQKIYRRLPNEEWVSECEQNMEHCRVKQSTEVHSFRSQ